jgi:hypothetical protein
LKCPYCEEELGLNNICINPLCSYFGTIIKIPEKDNINNIENNLKNKNSNETSTFDFNTGYDFDADYNMRNDNYYTIKKHTTYENTNKTSNKHFNHYSSNDDISREEFAAFIGNKNTNFYLKHVSKMESNHKFLSWNWACFFLSHYWLLYRKLYAPGAILVLLTFASSKLFTSSTHLFLMLIIRIILTLLANSIYLNNCGRKIRNIKMNISNFSTSQYINRLHAKGGVSLVAPLILLVIYIIGAIIYIAMWFAAMLTPHEFSSPSYYF